MSTPLYVAPGTSPQAENFPVASWLCPPRLRPPITAIYRFARTADDIADEGSATPAQRLAQVLRQVQDVAGVRVAKRR